MAAVTVRGSPVNLGTSPQQRHYFSGGVSWSNMSVSSTGPDPNILDSAISHVASASPTPASASVSLDNDIYFGFLENTSEGGANMSADYEYDYEASLNTLPLDELVPVGIVYSMTFLLGVIGNVLVIFAICRYRRMQSVTNTFLVSLASADLCLVLICVPIKFAKWFSFTWDFGEVMCKLVHYMQNVSVICSVLTLTAMSMERYYAILHPMRAKYTCTSTRARKVIAAMWLLSFVLATPIIFGQLHKRVGNEKRMAYWCIKEWPDVTSRRLYEMGMLFVILLIPVAVMTFAYASICKELWVVTRNRATMRATNKIDDRDCHQMPAVSHNHGAAQGDRSTIVVRRRRNLAADDDRTRKQVIKMLVAVILLFAICWAPTMVDNVLVAFGFLPQLHIGYLKHMRQAFVCMSYANSCVNPIVYAFLSKNFRQSFKFALCACVKGEKYVQKYRWLASHPERSSVGHTGRRDVRPEVSYRQCWQTSGTSAM